LAIESLQDFTGDLYNFIPAKLASWWIDNRFVYCFLAVDQYNAQFVSVGINFSGWHGHHHT